MQAMSAVANEDDGTSVNPVGVVGQGGMAAVGSEGGLVPAMLMADTRARVGPVGRPTSLALASAAAVMVATLQVVPPSVEVSIR